MKIQRSTILFVIVQSAGLACMFSWHAAPAPVASLVWGTATVALFPGNFASALLIETPFWNTSWPQTAIVAAEIPVLIAINATIWLWLARGWRKMMKWHKKKSRAIHVSTRDNY